MKKILIVSLGMNIGGAERSLITMLSELDYTKLEVDLFLLHRSGELLRYVPKGVKILKENDSYSQLAIPMREVMQNKKFAIAFGRCFAKILSKIHDQIRIPQNESYVELEYSHKYTKCFMPKISDKSYDLVISYLTPHYFAAEKTVGKKKIAWIHTDYSYIDCDVKSELRMWSRYDYVVAISDAVQEAFLKKFPSIEDKMLLIENTVSRDFIMEQANEVDVSGELDNDCIKLLSIGRFCNPKNFDNIPDICKRIRKAGLNIRWYIIGFGEDESLVKRRITESGMDEYVILLGKKTNPYPYIKTCDCYVQPSRYEGKAITVLEAQALGKPVAITAYPTAKGQLEDGVNGIIVPMDNEGCANGISELLRDREKMKQLERNCREMRFPNGYDVLYGL